MLTVNHCDEHGHETIYQADEVRYVPYQESPVAHIKDGPRLYLNYRNEQEGLAICGGIAFVMNASGKTVAKYSL